MQPKTQIVFVQVRNKMKVLLHKQDMTSPNTPALHIPRKKTIEAKCSRKTHNNAL